MVGEASGISSGAGSGIWSVSPLSFVIPLKYSLLFAPSIAVTVTVTLGKGLASLPVRVMTFKKPYAVLGWMVGTGSNSTTGVCSSGSRDGKASVGVGLAGDISGVGVVLLVGGVGSFGGEAVSDVSDDSDVVSSGSPAISGDRFSGNRIGGSGKGAVSDVGGSSDGVSIGVSAISGGRFSGSVADGSGAAVLSHAGGRSGADGKEFVGVVGAAVTAGSVEAGLDSAVGSGAGWARR